MEEKNDDLVFEISDDVYLHNWFFEVILAIILFLFLYLEMVHGINKSFAHIAIIYIVVSSIRKFYEFFIEKNKKLFFNKNKIERTNKKIELNISDIDEIYKISSIYFLSFTGIKRLNKFKIILSIVLFSWLFIPSLILLNMILAIYYKKVSIQKMLVIIGKTDNEVIIVPIPYHNKEKYEKLNNYLKTYLNTDINKLETNYFVPQKG